MSRIEGQPCWVLHRTPWRESSLLAEVFSAQMGRLGLVARGARGARSPWRGLIEPFVPLEAAWSRRGEMGTLTALEPIGDAIRLTGRALWCGLYANELLLRLTARDDPAPELFAAYTELLLSMNTELELALVLRRFELSVLEALGVVPDMATEADGGRAVLADGLYQVRPESGPVAASRPGSDVFEGRLLLALAAGQLNDVELARAARPLTRLLLDHQLGGRPLHTRSLFQRRTVAAGGQRGEIQ